MITALFICLLFVSVYSFQLKSSSQWRKCTQLSAVNEISTEQEFDELVKGAGESLVVVDYSTTWCGPCKIVMPKFAALSDKYPDVKFFKVVGDATPTASVLMKREGIRSVPAFHFWLKGERIDAVGGARIDDVEAVIKSNGR